MVEVVVVVEVVVEVEVEVGVEVGVGVGVEVEVEVEVGVEVEVMSELTEKRFRELKAEIEIVREESQRAQGALDQLMGRLKEEFDCSTLKEAKKELEKLTTERDKAEKEFEKALAAYETKWKNRE